MIEASMLLVNGENPVDNGYEETFKLIPIRLSCPYNEAIYDVKRQVLFIISKEKKKNIQQIEERDNSTVDSNFYYEYTITTHNEIVNFINMFCSNKDGFDFLRYMQN